MIKKPNRLISIPNHKPSQELLLILSKFPKKTNIEQKINKGLIIILITFNNYTEERPNLSLNIPPIQK